MRAAGAVAPGRFPLVLQRREVQILAQLEFDDVTLEDYHAYVKVTLSLTNIETYY